MAKLLRFTPSLQLLIEESLFKKLGTLNYNTLLFCERANLILTLANGDYNSSFNYEGSVSFIINNTKYYLPASVVNLVEDGWILQMASDQLAFYVLKQEVRGSCVSVEYEYGL